MQPFPLSALRRYEQIADITMTANSVQNLPTQGGQIVDSRWLWGLLLTLEGRSTMPAATGPSAYSADGLPALIERITLQGFHRVRQRPEKFWDLRGSDAYFMSKLYYLSAIPESPATSSFAANATNDFRRHIVVPFPPLGMAVSEQINYLLDTGNYETLKLDVQFGDVASAYGAYTNPPVLTAYGSTTGSPRVRVAGLFSLAGAARFANRVPGRIFRYFQEVTGSLMTTTATGVRLLDIPRGNFMRSVLLKLGTKQSVTAGNNAFATLSDTIATNINIMRGINRPIRYYPTQEQIRVETAINRGYAGVAGYNQIDFSPNGVLGESLDSRSMVSGSSGQTDLYLQADITGAANQALLAMWEEVQAVPMATARY